jgi:hypothetical protein
VQPPCGDGIVGVGEDCDDAADNDGKFCSDCQWCTPTKCECAAGGPSDVAPRTDRLDPVDISHYGEIVFVTAVYDPTLDVTTFNSTFKWEPQGSSRGLSHFVIGSCCDNEASGTDSLGGTSFSGPLQDPTTGIYGYKWDLGQKMVEGTTYEFNLLLKGEVHVGVVRTVWKIGRQYAENYAWDACPDNVPEGSLLGPYCPVGGDDVCAPAVRPSQSVTSSCTEGDCCQETLADSSVITVCGSGSTLAKSATLSKSSVAQTNGHVNASFTVRDNTRPVQNSSTVQGTPASQYYLVTMVSDKDMPVTFRVHYAPFGDGDDTVWYHWNQNQWSDSGNTFCSEQRDGQCTVMLQGHRRRSEQLVIVKEYHGGSRTSPTLGIALAAMGTLALLLILILVVLVCTRRRRSNKGVSGEFEDFSQEDFGRHGSNEDLMGAKRLEKYEDSEML